MRAPRGNVLLFTLIAVAVLLVVVVGAIRFTGQNREAAAAKRVGDERSACAEVARQYFLSRLQLYGVPVTSLPAMDERLPDAPVVADRTRVMTGHYGEANAGITLSSVEAAAFSEAAAGVREVGNSIVKSGTLGQFYRVVAKCRDDAGRESETEFVFRYGL